MALWQQNQGCSPGLYALHYSCLLRLPGRKDLLFFLEPASYLLLYSRAQPGGRWRRQGLGARPVGDLQGLCSDLRPVRHRHHSRVPAASPNARQCGQSGEDEWRQFPQEEGPLVLNLPPHSTLSTSSRWHPSQNTSQFSVLGSVSSGP